MTTTDEHSCASVMPELHIISSPDLGSVAFHPETYTLFRIDERTASILMRLKEGVPLDDVAQRHSLSSQALESLISRIAHAVEARSPVSEVVMEQPGALEKLVIHVSNDCNLDCRYCYASGGTYGNPRDLMTPELARQVVDRIFSQYPVVSFVMFFGGEPTLNPDAIEAVCERLIELRAAGSIPRLPGWGMVTNGLALTPKMEDLIRRYKLVITVSLDGPAELNDQLRVTRSGKGSYARIARNIRRIQEITDGRQPSKIEATYTPVHHAAGYSMDNLIDFFGHEFAIHDIHLAPVVVKDDHPLHWQGQVKRESIYRETAANLVESWLSDHPKNMSAIFDSVPIIVTRRSSRIFCGAGLSILAVSTQGDIYPCYVLLADEFKMGNIADASLFSDPTFKAVQERFRNNTKDRLSKCRVCWARGFCHLCFGDPYTENRSIDQIPDRVCAMVQATAESALMALSRVQSDPAQWRVLCQNVSNMVKARSGQLANYEDEAKLTSEGVRP